MVDLFDIPAAPEAAREGRAARGRQPKGQSVGRPAVPDSGPQAVAIPEVRSGDISSGDAKIGDRAVYRCINGNYWRAVVVTVRFKQGVDLDIFAPSGRRLLTRSRIPVVDGGAVCEPEQCYLGELPAA